MKNGISVIILLSSEYVDSGSDIESGSSIPSDSDVEYTPSSCIRP